jgi:hypothetical protein
MNMKKNRVVYVLAFLLFSMASLAYGRAAELKEPEPIIPPQGITLEKLDKVVDKALIQKGWAKKKKASDVPREIDVEYASGSHRVVVKLKYDISKLQLSYYSSEHLNFDYNERKKVSYIHPKYMVWTQQLMDQIKADFQLPESAFVNESASTTLSSANAVAVHTSILASDVPKEILSHFSKFKLEKTTINPKFNANAGNVQTGVNLDHGLDLTLNPKLTKWTNDKISRTLVIKPHIEAVRFIGGGARFFVGRMAGRSWIYVKVRLIDEASGEVIAEPEFYRIAEAANGYTLARADYKMVEDEAADITSYLENNYSAAIGGGIKPPQNIKSEL